MLAVTGPRRWLTLGPAGNRAERLQVSVRVTVPDPGTVSCLVRSSCVPLRSFVGYAAHLFHTDR